jgi:antirestriction protein
MSNNTPAKSNENETAPRLYVGTYAKYNAGSIKGAWLALTDFDDQASFLAACRELHKDEADPELMFQDFENMPKALYNESACPDLWEILSECERHGVEFDTLAAFVEHGLGDWDDVNRCADAFLGQYDNEEAYADQYIEGTGLLDSVPENLRGYFDTEKFARDLFFELTSVDVPGGVLVFDNR